MTENLLGGGLDRFDETKNWYEEYTKEGGKFYDPDPEQAKLKLAKAKAHSDYHINTLEREKAELREEYLRLKAEHDAANKLQEALDRLDKQSHASRDDTNNSNDDDTRPPVKEFDPKMIESLVSSKLQELEAVKKEQDNYNQVKSKIVERFGENFHSALSAQAERLGLTEQEVDMMARRQPKLFIKTFELDATAPKGLFQAPPAASTRNDQFAPTGRQTRKKSYYEKLRRENIQEYLDPKTLVQMEKDVQALGWDAFNDVP